MWKELSKQGAISAIIRTPSLKRRRRQPLHGCRTTTVKRGSGFPWNKHSVKKIYKDCITHHRTSLYNTTHLSSSRSSSSTTPTTMPKTLISVDPKKEPWNQDTPLHNRWHPDIVSLSIILITRYAQSIYILTSIIILQNICTASGCKSIGGWKVSCRVRWLDGWSNQR